jgi:hypothetical protein
MNQVYGWFTMPHSSSEVTTREIAMQWCLDAASAAGVDINASQRHIGIFNDAISDGNNGIDTLLGWWAWKDYQSITYMAHEVLHQYGLQHSRGVAGKLYGDPIDIMSAASFGGSSPMYVGPYFQASGPSMNAAYRSRFFNPVADDKVSVWSETVNGAGNATIDVVAIDHPEVAGPTVVKIEIDATHFYTFEFREKSGWDRAIPASMVAVRYWDEALMGTTFLTDLTYSHQIWSRAFPSVTVELNSIDASKHTANVTLTW